MAALITAETANEWEVATTSPSISTPAGSDGDRQVLCIEFTGGGSVNAPAISGWALESQNYIATKQNRMAVYTRVCSGSVSAGSVSPTFSGSVEGNYYCANITGTLPSISVNTDTSWASDRVIPATAAVANDALHMVFIGTASYPRTVRAVTGYTEEHDDFQYTLGGSYGIGLHVLSKSVSSGAIASITVPMYDTGDTTASGDQTLYASFVAEAFVAATGEGNFSVTGEFPVPSLVASRTTGGEIAVGATDSVTVTVVDQYLDPIPNATVVVGAAAGGVYTVGTINVTDANGETSFTITGAVAGTAALVASVGTHYSNELSITVVPSASNKIRRRRNRLWE